MKSCSAWISIAVLVAACSDGEPQSIGQQASQTGALTAVSTFGTNPGALNMYEYVPANVPANAPLVVALHGCTQSASDYVNAGWNELADIWGFYVVYAEQTTANNQNKCFDWYQAGDIARGGGEALSIKQMVDDMKSRHSIDASRVFVTGLSAGAAMTSVMLATYPDVFAAGAIMSGLPYDCATSVSDAYSAMEGNVTKTPTQWGDLVRAASSWKGPFPRVSIWQGSSDYTVYPANATELVKQWTNVDGIDQTADATGTVDGANHTEYRDGQNRTLVETYIIPNMGHGTAVNPGYKPANGCGQAGAFILSESICSTYYAGVFFGLGTAPVQQDAGAPDTSTTIDAGAPDVAQQTTCQTFDDAIYNHVLAGRAHRGGLGSSYVYANGSNDYVGLWNMMPATLRETSPGYYEVGACP
jgi:poly(hydroxyalkanoate) depolymerase family esterase